MDRFTRTIAMASARRPWRTVAAWVLVMGTVLFVGATAGGTFADDFAAPGSESERAMELLDQSFPEAAKGTALVVFAAEDGETLQSHREAITSVLADVATVAHVESIADPFAAGTVSQDGRIGYATLTLDAPEREIGKPAFAVLSEAVAGTEMDGVQVELGGDAVFLNAAEETSGREGLGILVALLVLLVVFGTLVAAIVPIGLAVISVGTGIGGILLLASTMEVSTSAIPVAGLVGLGVGIDYALFIVARYRENRAAGQDNRVALANAMGSSGAAVVFAGGTVVIATAALAITGLGILTSIGLSTALVVLVAVAAAITLLPAVLTLLGDRIDSGRLARRHRPAKRTEDSVWWRFGHRVSGRPWPYLLGAVVALLAIATPTLWIQTAFPAAGDAPTTTTHRHAYDLLAEGFGTGFNGPLLVVVDLDAAGIDAAGVPALTQDIASIPGIASVSEPQASSDGGTVVFSAVPTTGPADLETSETIDEVRAVTPGNVYVSGITAVTDDLNSQLEGHAPALHRSRDRGVVPAADAGVPVGRGAAEGGADEPALDRRRVRRPGRGLPVGLGQQPDRPRGSDPDHLADHRAHVPDPVRAVHGLRGVPAVADPRGVRADRRQRRVGRPRPGRDRTGDHVGRADHDRRLPQLRVQPGAVAEDARPRARRRDPDRRHHRADGSGAGHDGAAGQGQLVAPGLARPGPAAPDRRGIGRGR